MTTVRTAGELRVLAAWSLVLAIGAGTAAGLVLAAAQPVSGLIEPGAAVRFGLPAMRAVLFTAAVATVGLSVLPKLLGFDRPVLTEPAMIVARKAAVVSSAVWAVSALMVVVLLVAELRPGQTLSAGMVYEFLSKVGIGQALAFSTVCALLYFNIAVLAVRGGENVPAELRILVALFAVLPLPVGGHASNFGLLWGGHGLTMASMEMHIVSACLWTGGLTALVVFAGARRALLAAALPRFSKLATWCLVIITGTGLINTVVSITTTPGVDFWSSPYVWLILLKIGCLALVAALGAKIRFRLMPLISAQQRTPFIAWATAEIVVMGLAFGLAIVLARTSIA